MNAMDAWLVLSVKVAVHPRGPRKHCVISAYILNEKSRVRFSLAGHTYFAWAHWRRAQFGGARKGKGEGEKYSLETRPSPSEKTPTRN